VVLTALQPDSLLQWRAFFYRDAQYHRLGSANINQIPVNCPFMAQFVSPDSAFTLNTPIYISGPLFL
jgi:catalase